MRPYLTDFRLKVVRAYELGEGSQRRLAHLFGVSLSFVQGLLHRYRQTGSVEPEAHGGGNPGKIGPYLAVVQQLHQQQPDASLAERCEQLATAAQVHIGRTTMHRDLRQLGLTRKKRRSTPRNRTPLQVAKPWPRTKRRSTSGRPNN
jgi:transposase